MPAVTVATAQQMRAADQQFVAASRAEYHERMKGKPTPTQAECDLIKLGAAPKKEKSGAGPDFMAARMAARGAPLAAARR